MEPITIIYRYTKNSDYSFTVKSYHVPQPGDSVSLEGLGEYIVVHRKWIVSYDETKVIVRLNKR